MHWKGYIGRVIHKTDDVLVVAVSDTFTEMASDIWVVWRVIL